MDSAPELKYADVLLPLRLSGEVTYLVPREAEFENCREGSRVWVEFSSKRYCGVVTAVYTHLPHQEKEVAYKNLLSVERGFVRPWELRFWKNLADYYLCTTGEVYRAACPSALIKQQEVKSRKSPEQFFEAVRQEEADSATLMRAPELSEAQHEAFEKIGEFMEQIDIIIAGMTVTEERNKLVTFSKKYYHSTQTILVNQNNTNINSFNDLAGMHVGVISSTIGDSYIS